jgi:CARDB/Immunoglobulin I-set domain
MPTAEKDVGTTMGTHQPDSACSKHDPPASSVLFFPLRRRLCVAAGWPFPENRRLPYMNRRTPFPRLVLFTIMATLMAAAFPGWTATITWTNIAGGNWSVPSNWDVDQVPGPGDTAVITLAGISNNPVVVTLDVSPTVGGITLGAATNCQGGQVLMMNGQTLAINGALAVNACGQFTVDSGTLVGNTTNATLSGAVSWTGGRLAGTLTLAANGTLNLNGGLGVLDLPNCTLTNYGIVAWNSGTVRGGASGTAIFNYGVWSAQSDQVINGAYGGNGLTFYNSGTFLKLLGASTNSTAVQSGVAFVNSGTIDVESGVLSFQSGCSFNGGTMTGPGVVQWNGGTLANNSVIGGVLTWVNGGIPGGWVANVGTNGALVLAGQNGSDYYISGVLSNAGTVRLVSGNLNLYACCCGNQGLLVNLPGGLVDIQADVAIDSPCGGSSILNQGTFLKSGGTNATIISAAFNNTGLANAQSGSLILNGGGSGGGVFTNEPGATLEWNAGTFTGSIGGVLTWTGGYIAGGTALTVATNGTLVLAGQNGADYLVYGTLTNAGTLVLASGNLDLYACCCGNQGVLVNLPGALLDFETDVSIDSGCGGLLINEGTVQKSGGVGTSFIHPPFNSSGLAAALSGTLSVNGGGNEGGGIYTNAPGATMAWSGGALSGVIGGVLTWTGGDIAGGSTLTVASNGVLALTGQVGTDYLVYGILTNAGTLQLVSGNLDLYACCCGNQGLLVNLPGALVDVKSGVSIDQCGGGSVNNQGTFRKSGGNTTAFINAVFNNSGLADAQTGTLSFDGGGSSGGVYTNEPGATMEWSGGAFTGSVGGVLTWTGGYVPGGGTLNIASNGVLVLAGQNGSDFEFFGTVTNAGTIRLASGNLDIYACCCGNQGVLVNLPGAVVDLQADVSIDQCGGGYIINEGTFQKSGGYGTSYINAPFNSSGLADALIGTLAVNGGGVQADGMFANESGATMALTGGSLSGVMSGALTWIGGNVGGGTTLTVATNGLLVVQNSGDDPIYGILTNAGTIRLVSGNLDLYACCCGNQGALINLPGGLVDFQADVSIDQCGGGSIFNGGTFRKSVGTNTTTISAPFNCTGTVDAETGSMNFYGGFVLNGSLLNFGISGPTNFGMINVAGTANLDGAVSAALLNGYVPAVGTPFQVMNFGGTNGGFTDYSGLAVGSGVVFTPVLTSTSLTLDTAATNFTALAPIIISQPASQTAPYGGTATLRVSAAGSPPLQFQWSMDSVPLLGATNATLTLTNLQFNQSGAYAVAITNSAGGVTSQPAQLSVVPVLPGFAVQPANIFVPVGSNAVFTVVVVGEPPPTLQWLYNGTNLMDGGRISGSHSNVLTITDVLATDAGSYSVVASNAYGVAVSSTAVLQAGLPELVAAGVSGPANVLIGQPVPLVFTITNIGDGFAFGPWSDEMLLAQDTNGTSALDLGVTLFTSFIPPGSSITVTQTVILPSGLTGTQYFGVFLDSGNSLAQVTKTNNTAYSSTPVVITGPDLAMEQLNAPGSAQFGQSILITFAVTNIGTASATAAWYDALYFSSSSNSLAGATLLATLNAPSPLAPGAGYTQTQTVTLPLSSTTAPGTYYIVAVADGGGAVTEANKANNSLTSPIVLALPPLPDLAVTNIFAPASALAGQSVPLSWVVTNQGAATATAPWNEAVYAATDPAGSSNIESIATFTFTNNLPPGASITRTQSVAIPITGPAGNLWFVVQANSGGTVVESDETNDTSVASAPINIPVELTLSLPLNSISQNASNPNLVGSVSRNGGLLNATVVLFASSNTNALLAPASVVIPAGQAAAPFTLTVVNTGQPGANSLVTISASSAGYIGSTNQVEVIDPYPPSLALILANGGLATAGQTLGATLTRTGDTTQPLVVTVNSQNPSLLLTPATVTIPAGTNSAAFSVMAVGGSALLPTQFANFSVSATGYQSASATVAIQPNGLPTLAFMMADTNVNESAGPFATTGTLIRNYSDPTQLSTALTVSLAASLSNIVTLPGTLTFEPGQSQVSFAIGVLDHGIAGGSQTVTLSAQALYLGTDLPATPPVMQTLNIIENDGPALAFVLPQSVLPQGTNVVVSVTRNTPATNDLLVTLGSNNTNAVIMPASVTIPTGTNSASFTLITTTNGISGTIQAVNLTASASGLASGSTNLSVTDIMLPDLVVTSVTGPASGFTGQQIDVSYRVDNLGVAAVTNPVTVAVFLSPDPMPDNNAVLVGDFIFDQNAQPIPPGQWFSESVAAFLPQTPGNYWVIVTADPNNVITELSKNNNTRVSAQPIQVAAEYTALVSVALSNKTVVAGTPIPLTGFVTMADGSSPAYLPVTIQLVVRGLTRTLLVLTQPDGTFLTVWQPLANEAGIYTVGAALPGVAIAPVQDEFTILGATFSPGNLAPNVVQNSSTVANATLNNLGEVPLTNLTVSALNVPANLAVIPTLAANVLPGLGSVQLACAITASGPAPAASSFTLQVTCGQGVTVNLPVNVTVQPFTAQLVAYPSQLAAGMVAGQQRAIQFQLVNVGTAPSGPLTVVIPTAPWLAVASANPLPSLAPGQTNTVTLLLTPATNLPLQQYTGSLAVNGSNSVVNVPFTFTAVGEGIGALQVAVEDEFTFYEAGAPLVAGALAQLADPYDNSIVYYQATSDTNGYAFFGAVTNGNYLLRVTAPQHAEHDVTVTIEPGMTNMVSVLIPAQTVTYSWTAVPSTVSDSYDLTVNTTFETVVPFPVVTANPPMLVPVVIPGQITQTTITLTNSGLIAAQGVTLQPQSTATYLITPLVTDIGVIPALGSVTVPVAVQLQPSLDAAIVAALNPPGTNVQPNIRSHPLDSIGIGFLEECDLPKIEVLYFVICGGDGVFHSVEVDLRPVTLLEDMSECIKSILENSEKGLVGVPGIICDCASTAAAAINGALGSNIEVPKGVECLCAALNLDPVGLAQCICLQLEASGSPPPAAPAGGAVYITAVGGPGGGGGNCSFVAPQVQPAPQRPPGSTSPRSGGSICAQVQLQINQSLVLTRSAFSGTLTVSNFLDQPLSNISFTLAFFDANGQPADSLFAVEPPMLTGLTAVDGTGSLAVETVGTAQFTMIPSINAATNGQTPYTVGGTLQYDNAGQVVTIQLTPAPISVTPQPQLLVDYFHQRDVYAQDPFTPQIVMPSVPYTLAIMLRNVGLGPANNVSITSAQPQIVDNQKGLLINFQIIGTELFETNGVNELSPSLTVDFGNIDPGSAVIGRWLLTSSLEGLFIDYSATFQQVDPLGNPAFSLIGTNDVHIHELTHMVWNPLVGTNTLPDMLVNDDFTTDTDDLPDSVYLNDGTVQPVTVVLTATNNIAPSPGNLQVQLSAPLPGGWSYLYIGDPQGRSGSRQYTLLSVQRSDGTFLPADNFWQTDRTFIGMGQPPILENILHICDYNSTGLYTLTYQAVPLPDTTPPVSSVSPLPPHVFADFPVQWSGADNSGGPLTFNIYVSVNGGPFTVWLQGTTLLGAVYFGQAGQTYAFYSTATDSSGNREAPHTSPDTTTVADLVNTPPVLTVGGNQVVNPGDVVTIYNSATDTNIPAETLTFSLGAGSPAGATIDPVTGTITWPTSPADGSTTNVFTVVVSNNGFPPLSAIGQVTVIVRPPASPPALAAITNYTISEAQLLIITNSATDTNLPTRLLAFSLGAGDPTNATIDPASGVFRWRPTAAQAPSTNLIGVIVTDNGVPPLSATQHFTVTVRSVSFEFLLSFGSTNLLVGQTSSVPVVLQSDLPLTNITALLQASSAYLTGLTLQPASPETVATLLQPLGTNQYALSLTLNPALSTGNTRTLAQLGFAAVLQPNSAIVPLVVTQPSGVQANGQVAAKPGSANGRVIIVGNQPVLDLESGAAAPTNLLLVLYGAYGSNYVITTGTNLANPGTWTPLTGFVLTNAFQVINAGGATNREQFFRAVRQ